MNEDGFYVIPGRWLTEYMTLNVRGDEWYWINGEDGQKLKTFDALNLIATFSYLSQDNWASWTVARTLLSTPLPAGVRVFRYMTGEVSQGVVEMLKTYEEVKVTRPPQRMWELFNIIGAPSERICKGVAGYPDSVYLRLNVKNDVEVYYGYER